MPDDGQRYELVRGEVRMMSPSGSEHGRIAIRIGWRLAQHVEANELGATFAAETGFLLARDPDTVLAPDVAFVCQRRVDEAGDVTGYWPGPPDFAVEVLSPSDSYSRVEEKALNWLNAGCQMVVVVDPRQKHVTVFESRDNIRVVGYDGALDGGKVVPGWSIAVAEIFA